MLKDIIKAEPLDKYNLHLSFEDGVEGIADIGKLIEFTGIFEPLKSKPFFDTVKGNPEWGTIYWENGADLDPDVLYAAITGQSIPDYQLERSGKI